MLVEVNNDGLTPLALLLKTTKNVETAIQLILIGSMSPKAVFDSIRSLGKEYFTFFTLLNYLPQEVQNPYILCGRYLAKRKFDSNTDSTKVVEIISHILDDFNNRPFNSADLAKALDSAFADTSVTLAPRRASLPAASSLTLAGLVQKPVADNSNIAPIAAPVLEHKEYKMS